MAKLSGAGDLELAIDAIVSGLAREIGADHVFLFRHDAITETIRLDRSCICGEIRRGPSAQEVALWAGPFPDSATSAWRIMVSTRGLFTPDMPPISGPCVAWPGAEQYAQRFNVSDFGHIVLFAGDVPVGSIGFGLRDGRKLKPSDRPFIEGVASQAAVALRMADLAEQTKQAALARELEKAAEERALQLTKAKDSIRKTLAQLAGRTSLDDFIPLVLAEATIAAGAENGIVYRIKDNSFWLDMLIESGVRVDIVADQRFEIWRQPVPVANARAAIRKMRAGQLSINIIPESCGDLWTDTVLFHQSMGHRTLVLCPLNLGTSLLGVIGLGFKRLVEISPHQSELIQVLSQQAGLAIHLNSIAELAKETAIARERDRTVAEERSRMAREIHDTLAQGYAAILTHSQALSRMLPSDSPPSMLQYLDLIMRLAKENLAQARRTMNQLRTNPFEQSDLTSALLHCSNSRSDSATFLVELRTPPDAILVPRYVETELCRIVQEALQNVHRHSRAQSATVELSAGMGRLTLSVIDHGIGFDVTASSGGFGLTSMRERAARVGAEFHIQSAPGEGTEVRVTLEKSS
jgi:signal transduction histidine kinase